MKTRRDSIIESCLLLALAVVITAVWLSHGAAAGATLLVMVLAVWIYTEEPEDGPGPTIPPA